ncbi:MAG: hypothetical protein WCA16_18155 [Candidatus Sulfotelmatobacter sp.]
MFGAALGVVVLCLATTIPLHASGSISLGTIQVQNTPVICDSSWYSFNGANGTSYLNCYTATVTCNNTDNWSMTFGYLSPVGLVNHINTAADVKGLIIMTSGDGGEMPESNSLTDKYFRAGYEVAQFAWADDWEVNYQDTSKGPGNIQNAACRPATFFNYIYNTYFLQTISNNNSHAGFCALGTSAGSAAIAYSLAYYGAGDWFDHVELLSGPVLSDVKQGCQVPHASSITVCGQTNCSGSQCGCQLGGGSTWSILPTYVGGAQVGVRRWTNDNSCANANNSGSWTTWLNQSIVDQSPGGTGELPVPVFTYGSTGISAWLCRSVQNPNNYDCAAHNNDNSNVCPNNSSTQGQIFYANIGPSNLPPSYNIYAVDNCGNAEGVTATNPPSNVPGYQTAIFGGTVNGFNAIADDMVGAQIGQNIISAQCFRRH